MTGDNEEWLESSGLRTRAIRAGIRRSPEGEHGEPIFTSSSFVFDSAEDAAAKFSGDVPGNVYSRYTNPTVRTFEERLASLEHGESAVATASGMSAILAVCMAHLKAGDHVLCSHDVFGATIGLFENTLRKFGVDITFVPLTDIDAWRAASTPATKLLFLETPSNPMNAIADLSAMAILSREMGAILAIDNCFCTPVLQQPLLLGADLVTHSATKYLDGQGPRSWRGRRGKEIADRANRCIQSLLRAYHERVQRLGDVERPGNSRYQNEGPLQQRSGTRRVVGGTARSEKRALLWFAGTSRSRLGDSTAKWLRWRARL